MLVSASVDGTICIWDVPKWQKRYQFRAHQGGVYSVAISPDGKMLASAGADRQVRLWSLDTGKETQVLDGHKDKVAAVAFADGNILASGGYDGLICLWSVSSGKVLRELRVPKARVTALAFSPDGKTLISGGTANTIFRDGAGNEFHSGFADFLRVWDVAKGTQVRQLQTRGMTVACAADGKTIAAGGLVPDIQEHDRGTTYDGLDSISLLDVTAIRERQTIKWRGSVVAFSADARLLVSGSGSYFHVAGGIIANNGVNGKNIDYRPGVWELATGQEVLKFPNQSVVSATFAPNGRVLVVGTFEGPVLVWDLARQVGQPFAIPQSLDLLWSQLGGEAAIAYRAGWALSAMPEKATDFLKGRLRPVPDTDTRRIKELIAELDANQFATREAAYRQLKELGKKAELALRSAQPKNPSLEFLFQVDSLLKRLDEAKPSPDELQTTRAIQVLERIGSPEAQRVLENLAQGSPLAHSTADARAALHRLNRR